MIYLKYCVTGIILSHLRNLIISGRKIIADSQVVSERDTELSWEQMSFALILNAIWVVIC